MQLDNSRSGEIRLFDNVYEYGVKTNHNCTKFEKAMPRQSITITTPNDNWLSALVESEEYSSKSEIVNDLIRKARVQQGEIQYIRAKLAKAETSGFIEQSAEDLKTEFKAELRRDGKL
jgi:antitoxin ParD1/3/4